MNVVTCRKVAIVAALLALSTLGGCAEVHQNPASSVVAAQSDAVAAQDVDQHDVDQQARKSSSVPF